MGPRAGLDGRKISSPLGFDPRTVQPVVSRYTDWATRPTVRCVWLQMFLWTSKIMCIMKSIPGNDVCRCRLGTDSAGQSLVIGLRVVEFWQVRQREARRYVYWGYVELAVTCACVLFVGDVNAVIGRPKRRSWKLLKRMYIYIVTVTVTFLVPTRLIRMCFSVSSWCVRDM